MQECIRAYEDPDPASGSDRRVDEFTDSWTFLDEDLEDQIVPNHSAAASMIQPVVGSMLRRQVFRSSPHRVFGGGLQFGARPPRVPRGSQFGAPRRFATSDSGSGSSSSSKWKPVLLGGGAAAVGIGQYFFGWNDDFYDYRFITKKDPDDIAGFYGSEAFMDLFCVMPFMGTLMMRGGTFDDEGTVHTTGFPGTLLVSMVFSDEDDEDTGSTTWFNKRERFKDTCFGDTQRPTPLAISERVSRGKRGTIES